MVLADLGKRINDAVTGLARSNVVDEQVIDNMLKEICNALLESDVNFQLVANLRKRIKIKINVSDSPGINKKKLIQKTVFDELCLLVDCKSEPFTPKKKKSNVIMFVGLQGAGKTTTCTKLAVYYKRRGFKVAVVCADTFRAGAYDQLKQNANKARVAFYGSVTETDPVKVAAFGVDLFKKEKFEIIIVDTSGRHQQEAELFTEMIQIGEAVNPNQTIMVLDASIGQAAESQSRAFKESANFGAIILTKMDGHAKGGGAISAVAATNTPIVFIGTGEHIADIETFSPRQFISKLLGIGDIQGLMEHVKSLNLDQKETMKHLEQGIFTIRDFKDQLGNIMKMGPLKQIASMLPGGFGQMLNQAGEEETTNKLKRMIYILDSMTDKELDSDGRIFIKEKTRLVRVARGSGTSVTEVETLLMQTRMMEKMAGMSKNMMSAQNSKMNPQQRMKMMQQMKNGGGMPDMSSMMNMPGMQDMMKQFAGGAGGMPGMQDMMKQFGGGGMPDMSSMMNNPQIQKMMQQFGGGF